MIDLKDSVAVAAFALSVFNLIKAISDRRGERQITYEQKRQELLNLLTQRQSITEAVFSKAEGLAIKCDIWFGNKNELSAAIRGNVAMVSSQFTFDNTERLLAEYANPQIHRHYNMIEIEKQLGKAHRRLDNAREVAADVEESYKIWASSYEQLRKGCERGKDQCSGQPC